MAHVDTAEKSVAFQFALDTFLDVFREVKSLQHLISHQLGYPLAAPAFGSNSQKLFLQLYESLRHLTAQTTDYFPKEGDQGSLVRLCQECQKLSTLCQATTLHQLADKAWLEAHQAIQIYVHGEKRIPFLSHLTKMIKAMERFGNTWPKLLKNFRHDENILLFIARRHEDIDTLHGTKFVRELLQKLFPAGSAKLEEFITKAYLQRGFDHMTPVIGSTIEELGSW